MNNNIEKLDTENFFAITKKLQKLYNIKSIRIFSDTNVMVLFESGLTIDLYTIPLPERDIVAYKVLKPEYLDNEKAYTELQTLAAIFDMINMRVFNIFPTQV